jgi:DNA-binding Lrp family transcriptional regulator
MKPIERRVIAELMKNSRRSDRELAKAIGVSQPTISRTIAKLERDHVLREYTAIPDFEKLGYHICALTFANFETPSDLEAMRKLIAEYGKRLEEIPQAVVIERGLGEGANGVVISFHENYSKYVEFVRWLKQFESSSRFKLGSFMIDLDDKVHLRYLTFSTLASHMLKMNEKEE